MSNSGSSRRKQKTLDFFFASNEKNSGSPDLKNFTSRKQSPETSSRSSRRIQSKSKEVVGDLMEEDWESSDDEPIINRKRQTKLHRSPTELDNKRVKEDTLLAATTEMQAQEDFPGWTEQKREELQRSLNEDCQTSGQLTTEDLPELITGLKEKKYGKREVELFPFLHAAVIKDAAGRRPDDDGYDPSSVHIPASWFRENKITEAQQQWWTFKSNNFDSLLLFKVGKFYELYEMDAHAAVEALSLKYMRGEQPHCGFPEAAYHQMASSLAEKGFKVVVIEQTETPEQLKLRNEKLKSQNRRTAKVVSREKVAVLTKGSLREAEMIQHPDSNFLMALLESCCSNGISTIGFCAVDAASCQILFAEFQDDELFTILRTHLSILHPVELILPDCEDGLRQQVKTMIQKSLPTARINSFPLGDQGFCSPRHTAGMLQSYFHTEGGFQLPEDLQQVLEELGGVVLSAAGGIINFLRQVMLDQSIIPICKFRLIKTVHDAPQEIDDEPEFVFLDSSALDNLEIFTNSEGKSKGTLFSFLDHCTTPFGKRLLKSWVSTPLGRISEIEQRQMAVQDLISIGADAAGKFRKKLATVGDLERTLSRLHSSTLCGAQRGREAAHVVLYEDSTKKKVKVLLKVLSGLQSIHQAVLFFQPILDQLQSPLLRSLVAPGDRFPVMEEVLSQFFNSVDWHQAEQVGRVIPSHGLVPRYDAAKQKTAEKEQSLEQYLESFKDRISARVNEVNFTSVMKDRYLIEVSDRLTDKIPEEFELVRQKKGSRRYTCTQLKSLVQDLEKSEEACEQALVCVLQDLIQDFVSHQELWTQAVNTAGQLDALMSLAVASCSLVGPMCCPKLSPYSSNLSPIFKATQLRHPCVAKSYTADSFIPNDIYLGGESQRLMLLTGANMGGKSTLLRQVCLATLLAQIGAFVPAVSLEITPVDCIFVRMGAKDHIVCGQSTFYVELSDTASMLNRATRRSLVALDELGRGTATRDGEAIASAVLEHLRAAIKCRGLFTTHYHSLAKEFEQKEQISVKHMACLLTPRTNTEPVDEEQDLLDVQDVTFLYRLADGVAPRSYGMNVARLAGVPECVIRSASSISASVEKKFIFPATGSLEETEHDHAAFHALLTLADRLNKVDLGARNEEELQKILMEFKRY